MYCKDSALMHVAAANADSSENASADSASADSASAVSPSPVTEGEIKKEESEVLNAVNAQLPPAKQEDFVQPIDPYTNTRRDEPEPPKKKRTKFLGIF
jgi:hypothetical protein